MPYLWPENQPIYSVYSRVSGQHIMADYTPIELNLMPVFKVMGLVGIKKEDHLYCIDMLRKVYHHIIKIRRDKK